MSDGVILPGANGGGFATPPVFTDGKAPDALRTIGEVAAALGIRQHVLRYWEEQFPALSPLKRSGGRRYYRPEDVRLVSRINDLLHHQGYTIRGARAALAGSPHEPVHAGGAPAPAPAPAAASAASAASSPAAAPDRFEQPAADMGRLRAVRDSLAAALGET